MTDETTTDDDPSIAIDGPETGSLASDPDPSLASEGSDDQEPDTFPRTYVEQLRQENAGYHQKATRADEATARLLETTVRSAAADHLADPGDLLTFTDADALVDDDGWPDADRIVAAAKALAQTKPHLAPRRPRGDIGQGATPDTGPVNLAALLRERAS